MAQKLSERINKWDYITLKSICTTKEVIYKLKRLPTEREKIFAIYTSDRGLIRGTYRGLKKLNSQVVIDPMKK
jgi:hypothetical protein